jgi:hypothetical protein
MSPDAEPTDPGVPVDPSPGEEEWRHDPTPATAAARRFVTTVVVACLLGAAANVFVQAAAPASHLPIRAHAGGTLTALIESETPSVRTRYMFPTVLGDTLDGGTLVVPAESLVERFLVEGLAGLALEVQDYDPEIDALTAQRFLGQGTVAEGALHPEGEAQTFVVVTEPVPAEGRYRLLSNGGVAFVVPEQTAIGSGS